MVDEKVKILKLIEQANENQLKSILISLKRLEKTFK